MLVSKYKNKLGNECVSIVVGKNELVETKNPNVYRITLSPAYEVHLDEKKKISLDKLFHLENLIDNTFKKEK